VGTAVTVAAAGTAEAATAEAEVATAAAATAEGVLFPPRLPPGFERLAGAVRGNRLLPEGQKDLDPNTARD
jgi:hypothetical protein